MRVIIYAERRADEIRPGDVIDGGQAGLIEVDEKRERLGGGVQLLGNPPGQDGRRKTLAMEAHHLVRVMPTARQADRVWEELRGAVDLAVDAWAGDHPDAAPDASPPWDAGEGTAIAVQVAAGRFLLNVDHTDGPVNAEAPPVDKPGDTAA